MSVFDSPDPAYDRQQRLWSAAKNLDLAALEVALADGAPPEPALDVHPHGRESPLALAVGTMVGRGTPARERTRLIIIDRLIAERTRHPALSPPRAALVEAFRLADRLVLEKLLPLFPEGVNHAPPGATTLLLQAIQGLEQDAGFPVGRMTHIERLKWLIDNGAHLENPPSLAHPDFSEPLPYAISRLKIAVAASRKNHQAAVALLIENDARLWSSKFPDKGLRAAIDLAGLNHEPWTRWLLGQVPPDRLDEVQAALPEGPVRSGFHTLRLEQALGPGQESSDTRPRPRV